MTETDHPESRNASVAMHYVRLVTDYVSRQGVVVEQLLDAEWLPELGLHNPEARLPYVLFSRLCERAAATLDDPCFGLHVGESVMPGHLGSHGFALMSCDNVRDMLQRSLRYSSLVLDAYHHEFRQQGTECVRYWRGHVEESAHARRLQQEMNLALWVSLARWVTGRPDLNPSWVSFASPTPQQLGDYERLFRCPLHFHAEDTALAFPAQLLDLPLPQANQAIRQMLEGHRQRLLLQLGEPADPDWLVACRKAILHSFEQGMPDVPTIAVRLGLDTEQLGVHLARRNLSFRGLVEDIRRELAMGYIGNLHLSLADIAYLLGFSEQSAFQRAFKRWTGMTPGEYRRSQTPPAGSA